MRSIADSRHCNAPGPKARSSEAQRVRTRPRKPSDASHIPPYAMMLSGASSQDGPGLTLTGCTPRGAAKGEAAVHRTRQPPARSRSDRQSDAGRCLLRKTGRNPQKEEGAKTGNPGDPVPAQSGQAPTKPPANWEVNCSLEMSKASLIGSENAQFQIRCD